MAPAARRPLRRKGQPVNLEQLGWKQPFIQRFSRLSDDGLIPARVARQDRGSYVLYASQRALRAAVSGHFRHLSRVPADFPAVGDWVGVAPRDQAGAATIHALLPRQTALARTAAGTNGAQQVIAANVDVLLICTGLDRDFNLRRIERYLSLAYSCGVAPALVLTKRDVCDSAAERVAAVGNLAPGAAVVATSVFTGEGLEQVRALVGPQVTVALVGSSGVGKSTLINALVGEVRMSTGHVRVSDGRGRHTTTHRQLIPLVGGGVLIDTPGMRELALPADGALDGSFAEIESLAADCRFRDCGHESEPGCAVLRAVQRGELELGRLESFRRQQRELAYLERRDDPVAESEHRARWKAIHKAARKHMRSKYGD